MSDREARVTLATALAAFMRQQIFSDAFDDVVSQYAWCHDADDGTVKAIAAVLYTLYSDVRNESIHVTEEVWNALLRTLAFLQTDLDYSYGAKDLPGKWDAVRSFWPFSSDEDWRSHQHLQPGPFPKWDRVFLPPVPKSVLRALAEVLGILALAIAIFVAIVSALLGWAFRHT